MRKLANNLNSYDTSLQITSYCSCDAVCPLYDDPLVSYAHHYRILRDGRSKL